MKNNKIGQINFLSLYVLVVVMLYFADLFIISQFSFSSMVRVQDFAGLMGLPVLLIVVNRINRIIGTRSIFVTIVLYMSYLVISNLIFFMFEKIDIRFIFYIIKELEYFIAMFLIVYIVLFHFRISVYLINSLLWMNLIFGALQFISGKISYYGIGALIGPEPAASGIVYLTCAYLSFFFWLEDRKKIYIIQFIVSVFLTIMTLSKTSILGIGTFIFISLLYSISQLFSVRYRVQYWRVIIFLAIFCIIILAYLNVDFNKIENIFYVRLIGRFGRASASLAYRTNKAETLFLLFNGDSIIKNLIGSGKGVPEYYFSTSTLGVDNQFVRFIIEMGVVGIVFWISIIININVIIRRKIYQIPDNKKYYSSFLIFIISYTMMGVGYEVFQTTKSGLAFWLIIGLIYGLIGKSHLGVPSQMESGPRFSK